DPCAERALGRRTAPASAAGRAFSGRDRAVPGNNSSIGSLHLKGPGRGQKNSREASTTRATGGARVGAGQAASPLSQAWQIGALWGSGGRGFKRRAQCVPLLSPPGYATSTTDQPHTSSYAAFDHARLCEHSHKALRVRERLSLSTQ